MSQRSKSDWDPNPKWFQSPLNWWRHQKMTMKIFFLSKHRLLYINRKLIILLSNYNSNYIRSSSKNGPIKKYGKFNIDDVIKKWILFKHRLLFIVDIADDLLVCARFIVVRGFYRRFSEWMKRVIGVNSCLILYHG